MATPRLFHDVRTALACLYSLSPSTITTTTTTTTTTISAQQAHDFLMHFQSRNVRRKLHSIQQSDCDLSKQNNTDYSTNRNKLAEQVEAGSTWLACLALLSCVHTQSAERLFAAQTLMHRLRRAKIIEAIDVEMEDPNKYLSPQFNVNLQLLVTDYAEWMQQFHPVLSILVQRFLSQPSIGNATNEEQVKGELAMLTLASIIYLMASHYSHNNDANTSSILPLLSTLSNALAVTALRLRFTPQSVTSSSNNNKATLTSAPLVTMILQSLSAAAAAAADTSNTTDALFYCYCSSLGVLPEALLSSNDGAMGRISIDPRCIQAVHGELRQPITGVCLVWQALQQHFNNNLENDEVAMAHVLQTCQTWAQCVPLPHEFVESTMPWVHRLLTSSSSLSLHDSKMTALSYLIAIYEAGAWTADYILTFSLGLLSQQQPAISKKRQTSRSKRRQQERIDTSATDELRLQAQATSRHCGEMACLATRHVWEGLAAAVQQSLMHSTDVGGEGPVGCLCACANACLPHWLRKSSVSEEDATLAVSMMNVFQEIASHSHRTVRALVYEPLYTLNTALLEVARVRNSQSPSIPPGEMEAIVANHLFQCTMRLATSCGYPSDYFDDMAQDNDEEMEVERNDVRDMIRAVCGCQGDIARENTSIPMDVSMQILEKIVCSCGQACDKGAVLPPETAVHALSALAKPVNTLADAYSKGYRCDGISETLLIPLQSLQTIHQNVIAALGTFPLKHVFAVCRLSNLATAAFAPTLSALCMLDTGLSDMNRSMARAAFDTVDVSIHAAALSIVHVPELAAASTLDHTQYDIRGALRSPGGEDHVGILTLLRLANESDELARTMVAVHPSLSLELCKLHEKLKSIEVERGPGIIHGSGVAPKSRRILCQTICHIAFLGGASGDNQEALAVLDNMFLLLMASIAESTATPSAIDGERMYRICEGVLDLAAFAPSMVASIFDSNIDELTSLRTRFLEGVIRTSELGYSGSLAGTAQNEAILQWGRLRGALVGLVSLSVFSDIPATARDAIVQLTRSECSAIASQCATGPAMASPIFNESVISEDLIPSGIFVRLLGQFIEKQQEQIQLTANQCIATLQELRPIVLESLLLECPEPTNPSFVDPRPALCEAWYLSMCDVMDCFQSVITSDESTRTLLADSCCIALLLLLYKSLPQSPDEVTNHVGMTLDGPQTRAVLLFFEKYFLLGPEMLRAVLLRLRYRLDIDIESIRVSSDDTATQGVSILGACLYRAASGGLPPWAIEVIPSLYASLFVGCGNDYNVFCRMLELAMDVRLSKASSGFGVVRPGELLAGRYFESAKKSFKETFVEKSREACRENNGNGWRRFKVLLKQACGGKKKSSLGQKPSFTAWDVERI